MSSRLVWILLNAGSSILLLGFIFHTSSGSSQVMGKYSSSYAMWLTVLTALYLLNGVLSWRNRRRLLLVLKNLSIVLLASVSLGAIILPGAYIYLHHRTLSASTFAPLDPEAHAFWQIEVASEPPHITSGQIRVLTLGGSTTYGSLLERSEAYPTVLEGILRKRFPFVDIQVFNAGVPWHTSLHSLLRYVARFTDWKPHVVIVMHAFNDIYQTSEGRLTSGQYRSDYGHFFGALGRRVNPTDLFADRVSDLILGNWIVRNWYSDLRSPASAPADPPVDLLRALPSFRRNMNELISRVGQDGAMVVLTTQPSIYRIGMLPEEAGELFYPYYYSDYGTVPTLSEQMNAMQAFNSATRDLARRAQVSLIDVDSRLPKTKDFMYDDVHYTAEGAQRVAEIIAGSAPWTTVID